MKHLSTLRTGSLVIGILGFVMAVCLVGVRADGGGNDVVSKIEANLAGGAINGLLPRGEAETKTFVDGNRKFEVDVTNVNLPDGTLLNVSVDGAQVGRIRLIGLMGEFEVETADGQIVPPINSRTRVVVSDQAGNTIVAGSFSNIPPPGSTPTPTPGVTPSPTPTPNPNSEVRIEARLAGASINGLTPKGNARFRSGANGRRDLKVEVEKINLPAGTSLNILVDNTAVGQIILNPTMENELELETEHGAVVPNVVTGSTVVVSSAQGKTILSGVFNTTASSISGNDIDDSHFFVEQHYRDFFDREADDNGLDFWEHQITNCGDDSGCHERARINTSGAFFLSIEFQETGYLLYRFNKASFGTMPRRNDFMVEMQAIAQGVVVGQVGWEQKLADNKRAAAERWANRPDFRTLFDDKSNRQFVTALFANTGITPSAGELDDLVSRLDAGLETRGSALRRVSENARFSQNEKNPAFVLMQYFGYLHRNPDEGPDHDMSGFNFWLHKLDDNGGDFHRAEMVKSFLVAGEYRDRFNW